MLHQPITADDDPDLQQAVDHLGETVAELRVINKDIERLPRGGAKRAAASAYAAELTSRVALRAERLGVSTEALIMVISDAIDRKARRGRGEPSRPSSRTLMTRIVAAQGRLADANRVLADAIAAARAARSEVRAAEEAYKAYGAERIS